MSLLVAGNYVIVNQVHSNNGVPLAVTYNGADHNSVSVTEVQDVTNPSLDQVWTFSNDGDTQTISPQSNSSVEITQGPGTLQTFTASGVTWFIQGTTTTPNAYTVQDGAQAVFWNVVTTADEEVYDGEVVSLNANGDLPTEDWLFYSVSS